MYMCIYKCVYTTLYISYAYTCMLVNKQFNCQEHCMIEAKSIHMSRTTWQELKFKYWYCIYIDHWGTLPTDHCLLDTLSGLAFYWASEVHGSHTIDLTKFQDFSRTFPEPQYIFPGPFVTISGKIDQVDSTLTSQSRIAILMAVGRR